MYLGASAEDVQIVGLFKASEFGRVPAEGEEVRRRCKHCGWVNIFRPLQPERGRASFELK
jgi:hypothetical protein